MDKNEYPQRLVDAVFGITEDGDPEETVPQVLHRCGVWADLACAFRAARLTEREEIILMRRYMDGQTLEEVGRQFGVTRSRIREVEVKALRKLRHPSSAKILKDGVEKYMTDYMDSLRQDADQRVEDFVRTWVEEHPDGHAASADELLAQDALDRSLTMTVEELDLSVRAYNCLKRAGCETVNDLVTMARTHGLDGFMGIRNLGRQSMEEIFAAVKARTGIDLRKEFGKREDQAG